MKKKMLIVFYVYFFITNAVFSQEQVYNNYFGTAYNTSINDDRVNVRSFPSMSGEVLFQLNKNARVLVIGVSQERNYIDNYDGNWLCITVNQNQENQYKQGWVFSKYVDIGNVVPSELRITEVPPKMENRMQTIIGSYTVGGVEKRITIVPDKEEDQDFYTFAFDIFEKDFHYSNVPGSYIWYPDTNELKHVSYTGTSIESAWVKFTDDFKYLLEDFGTSPGVRALGIWRVSDNKRIFSGSYYRDIKLHGHTIEIVYNANAGWDQELIEYAQDFRENNPKPTSLEGYGNLHPSEIGLIIVCNFNMDTGERKIISGRYIFAQ